MNIRVPGAGSRQRGIVLISSLLLLLVITILALAMFRSMGLAEKIAGNVREKQRALHSAVVAEQFAEWYLSSGNANLTAVVCNAPLAVNNGSTTIPVCSNALNSTNPNVAYPATLPWTDGNGNSLGYTYSLPASAQMYVTAQNGSYENTYYQRPAFYIQYVGPAADSGGNVYRIDAVGWGGSPLSVAVVESMYEIGSGVKPLDQP